MASDASNAHDCRRAGLGVGGRVLNQYHARPESLSTDLRGPYNAGEGGGGGGYSISCEAAVYDYGWGWGEYSLSCMAEVV